MMQEHNPPDCDYFSQSGGFFALQSASRLVFLQY